MTLSSFFGRLSLLSLLLLQAALATRQMENLDRGVIALPTATEGVFISWRLLGTEAMDTGFKVYRSTDGGAPVLLTPTPLTQATCFSDTSADRTKSLSYTVRSVQNSVEQPAGRPALVAANAASTGYLSIPLLPPASLTMPDGSTCTYAPGDASVGDLDGDGQYELVLKWDPSNAKDNSQAGHTGNVYLDAYRLDGRQLWRIDLGRNIRAGAHYTQFMVYDLNGDGVSEVACRTSDGSVDGVGRVIGDGTKDHRNPSGYILSGPEFLSVFAGPTGAEVTRVNYTPTRTRDGSLTPSPADIKATWGDDYGNRIDRFLACVAYLDGSRPSLVMCRGYYTRAVLVAYDLEGSSLRERWVFDSDDGTPGNLDYKGQGFHNLSVADVDADGRDEIVYGACTIDDNGKGLYSTKLGHGDASHLSDFDPDRPGLEQWSCHEDTQHNGNVGLSLREAATGKLLFSAPATTDIGRGVCYDIDPRHKGAECWGALPNLYNVKGEIISATRPASMNFAVWWDGDLLREILDGNYVDKWDYENSRTARLLTATGCTSNNGTKSNPCLSADILGDWREEIVWRSTDNRELRIYSTTLPTQHRLRTLMHDPHYRLSVAWQNVAYNQPPHTGFYLGEGMAVPTAPDIRTRIPNHDAVITNISIRARTSPGEAVLNAGFVLSDSFPVLLRGVGPTLATYQVPEVLADPALDLYRGGVWLDRNEDWSAGATASVQRLAAAADSLGAFPLANPSKDAALLPSLEGGLHACVVTPPERSTGIVLFEAYAIAPDAGRRFTNVSARTYVDGSNPRAIAGFVIQGSTPRTVLIRAVGPRLKDFSVSSAMPDPLLELYSGQAMIDRNNDWEDSNATSALFDSLGAFSLTQGSRDAALLANLPPGAYSAHAYPNGPSGDGTVLVEVYEVR